MYKARLQEMCHRSMWAPPDYTVTRDGPDHDPRFRATVTVNGVSFHAPELSKSSKDAQNKAAQVAVDQFHVDPPKPSSQPPIIENHIPYKSQLLTYAQRNIIDLPKYDVVREGCAHAPRFKANVTVNGQTFNSLQLFKTLKEAENDAAMVALSSLSLDGNTRDKSNLYKNLLQELAQKNGISLPKYNTVSNAAGPIFIFSSTVEIGGDSFMGDAANTKKQAEMNAAKVAWCKLNEGSNANTGKASLSPVCLANEHLKPASSGSQSKIDKELELSNPFWLPLSDFNMKYNGDNSATRQEGGITDKNGSSTVMDSVFTDYQGALLTDLTNGIDNEHMKKISASHNNLVSKEDTPIVAFSEDGDSTPSSKSDCTSIVNVIAEYPVTRTSSSLFCNRVRVYPRIPGMVLPEGATMLPFSDDTWVAVSLDFPNHEGLDADFERSSHSSSCSLYDDLIPVSIELQSKATQNLELPYFCSVHQPSVMMKHSEESSGKTQEDKLMVENGTSVVDMAIIHQGGYDAHFSEQTIVDGNEQHTTKMSVCQNILDAEVPNNKDVEDTISQDGTLEDVEDTISRDGTLEPSLSLDHPVDLPASVISDSPMGVTRPTLLCNRVRVYPHKPDMVLPDGATLLPFSGDMWVAVSLDFSNHEDVYQDDGIAIESNGSPVCLTSIGKEICANGNGNDHFDELDSSFHNLDIEVSEDAFLVDGTPLSSIETSVAGCGIVDVGSESPVGGVTCSLECNRVQVHPSKPDLVLPDGALQLPFSDDKWTAVSLNL